MPVRKSIPIDTVLSEEYAVLRPESDRGERKDAPLSALCISGGGIRSATFALGAIQGLAESGILGEFDYLSTVSGGGYIGAWLTSWKQRAGGMERVIRSLRQDAPSITEGESDAIQHLREYNSYLSPKLGLLSADTWTLAATVVRNMLLNWLVFVPLLLALLLPPRLILSIGRVTEIFDQAYGVSAYTWAVPLTTTIFVISGLLFAVATCNMMRYLPGVGRAEHSEFDFIKWVLAPLILSTLAFIINDSWFTGGDLTRKGTATPQLLGYWPVVAGVIGSALLGWLAYLVLARKPFAEHYRLSLRVAPALVLAGWMAGSAAWVLVNFVYPSNSWPVYTSVAPPVLLLTTMLSGCLFVGLASRELKDEDHEWLSRAGAWILLYVAAWTAICVLVLLVPTWVMEIPVWGQSVLAGAGVAGGWVSALAGHSQKSTGTKGASGAQQSPLIIRIAMALAAPVFAVTFLAGLAIATDWLLRISKLGPDVPWWNHQAILEGTRWESILLLGVFFLLLAWLMAHFININKFSLHAMYRNRLIRAYLGASNHFRQASQFTGLAENDDIPICALDPWLKPLHVVNVCLNVVAGERLAWQQRKAESFTISPLHSGSANLGYRPSKEYGGAEGITLGTAVTISGAAASPNMGYHSSPVIGFIMTLFNARLGCWLGNPGPAGDKTWQKDGPTSAIDSLVKEAFGLTNNTNEWVYLSDGGHFDNLGLYEMVRRRCRQIVVLDGGCDADFTYGDLGNSLRKIRIDLKIPIDFDERSFRSLRDKESRFAAARICYSSVDPAAEDGYLIYVKPMMRGNEPPDVASYCSDEPAFPHQSTAQQFFNESQTESYRALGAHTIAELCREWDRKQGIAGLVACLADRRAG